MMTQICGAIYLTHVDLQRQSPPEAGRDCAGLLWSLREIVDRFAADRLVKSVFWLEFWICRCKRKLPEVTTNYARILQHVNEALATCRDAGFDAATLQIDLLYQRLTRDVDRTNHDTISHLLRSVQQQLQLAAGQQYFVRLNTQRATHHSQPLVVFGEAAEKFFEAQEAMKSASRCFALEEWDACVFHSMRVLERGLRWLASRINTGPFPLTLTKPVELESWGNIIDNIGARINEELGPQPPGSAQRPKKTLQRDEDLAFYAKAATEFRYFKDAWRNHVMHDRHDPYEEREAALVLGHVATFMQMLATRA